MKKAFKLAAMAVAIVGLMAACKQNAPETADTTPIDTMMVEEFTDTVDTVEAVAEEEPVKTTAKKTTAKKEEPTTQQKLAANEPSFRLLMGLWTAETPWRERICQSSGVV